jgi:hypothetical protein
MLQHVGTTLARSLLSTKAASEHGAVGKDTARQDKVAQAVANVQDEEGARLGGLISQLQQVLSTLPDEHLQQVRQELVKELSR